MRRAALWFVVVPALIAMALALFWDGRWPNMQVRNQLAGVEASDVVSIQLTGYGLRKSVAEPWMDDGPDQIVSDPMEIAKILRAFQDASARRPFYRYHDADPMPSYFVFRLRPELRRTDVVIHVDETTVDEQYGPHVKRIFERYRQRTIADFMRAYD